LPDVSDLLARFGSARHPDRPVVHPRPADSSDATVDAVGQISAAFEVVVNARGFLYGFHRMSGEADLALQDAVAALRSAGHADLADEIDQVLVGRDVVPGRWTFELVEAYDEHYFQVFQAVDALVRERLSDGRPHVYEAEMKQREQRSGAGAHSPIDTDADTHSDTDSDTDGSTS
jgi:hypothetical protein